MLDKVVYALNAVLSVTTELNQKELAIVECQRIFGALSAYNNPCKMDSAYIIKSKIAGFIFDLDGTITLPGTWYMIYHSLTHSLTH